MPKRLLSHSSKTIPTCICKATFNLQTPSNTLTRVSRKPNPSRNTSVRPFATWEPNHAARSSRWSRITQPQRGPTSTPRFRKPSFETNVAVLGATLLLSSTFSTAITMVKPLITASITQQRRRQWTEACAKEIGSTKPSTSTAFDDVEPYLKEEGGEKDRLTRIQNKLGLDPKRSVTFDELWDKYTARLTFSSEHGTDFGLDRDDMVVLLKWFWRRVPELQDTDGNYIEVARKLDCVTELLDDMRALGFAADEAAYHGMIGAHVRLQHLQKARDVLQGALAAGMKPNTRIFAEIIKSHSERLEFHAVQAVYQDFLNTGSKPDITIFNALLENHFRNSNQAAVMLCLEEMESRYVTHDRETSYILIKGWTELGDPDRAEFYLNRQIVNVERVDYRSYAVLFRSLADKRETARCEALLKRLERDPRWNPKTSPELAEEAYTSMVRVYVAEGKLTRAAMWIQRMHTEGLPSNAVAYNTLLREYFRRDMAEHADSLLQEMDRLGIDSNATMIDAKLESAVRSQDVSLFKSLIGEMNQKMWEKTPSLHADISNRMIFWLARMRRKDLGTHVFNEHRSPNDETYLSFFNLMYRTLPTIVFPYESVRRRVIGHTKNQYKEVVRSAYTDATNAWKRLVTSPAMNRHVTAPSLSTHISYMKILLRTRNVDAVENHYNNVVLPQGIYPSEALYEVRLASLIWASRMDDAKDVFFEMRNSLGKSTVEAFSSIIKGYMDWNQPKRVMRWYPVMQNELGRTCLEADVAYLNAVGQRTPVRMHMESLSVVDAYFRAYEDAKKVVSRLETAVAQSEGSIRKRTPAEREQRTNGLKDDLAISVLHMKKTAADLSAVCVPVFYWWPRVALDREAIEMYLNLIHAGVEPSIDANNALIASLSQKPCCRPRAALSVYNAWKTRVRAVSRCSGLNVMRALGRACRMREALAVYNQEMQAAKTFWRTRRPFAESLWQPIRFEEYKLVHCLLYSCLGEAKAIVRLARTGSQEEPPVSSWDTNPHPATPPRSTETECDFDFSSSPSTSVPSSPVLLPSGGKQVVARRPKGHIRSEETWAMPLDPNPLNRWNFLENTLLPVIRRDMDLYIPPGHPYRHDMEQYLKVLEKSKRQLDHLQQRPGAAATRNGITKENEKEEDWDLVGVPPEGKLMATMTTFVDSVDVWDESKPSRR